MTEKQKHLKVFLSEEKHADFKAACKKIDVTMRRRLLQLILADTEGRVIINKQNGRG